MRRVAPWLIPVAALLVFVSPMIVTSSGFASDWTNHLWLVWRQSLLIDAGGPSLYVHADGLGVFYPHFVFYGGTLYAWTALLALVIGDATTAYVLSFALAFAAAYGGTTWLSMQCGLSGWRAQIPGLFVVTSAYYLTNVYGRGAWPELVAVSSLPLLVASATHLVRRSWSPWPLAAFIAAAILFTGSHNITLLVGSMFLAGAAVVLVLAARRAPTRDEVRRALGLLGVGTLSVGVNLWFLLPDLFFASRTAYLSGDPFFFEEQHWLSDLGILFSPARPSFPELAGTPGEAIHVQLPTLLFVWLGVALLLMARRATVFQRRLTIGLVVLAVPFAFFTATTEPWHWLPNLLHAIQFGYRLETYVILATAGLLIVALTQLGRAPSKVAQPLTVALVAIMLVSSGLAVWQVSNPGEYLSDRDGIFGAKHGTPGSWYDKGFFRDYRDAPVIRVRDARTLELDGANATSGSLEEVVDPPPGRAPIRTNIGAGHYLVDVEGLEVVGRTANGYMVVRRPADRPTGRLTVRITRPRSGPAEIGRILSLVSAIGLFVVLVATITGSVRRRRASSGTTEDAEADRYPLPRGGTAHPA